MSSNVTPASSAGTTTAFTVTDGYRWYLVWLLFGVYVLNFVDRQILTILLERIKEDFDFTDAQLGLLSGFAFALLYSVLGIPIARLADRRNRVNIIAASLFVWSAFTVFTGMAKNFTQLFLMRVGVGIGEAGCTPPAYSLLSDYFEKKRRTTAIAIYTMGIYGGVFIGYLVGSIVAAKYGWRTAFYVVGAPGIVMALVVKLTVREPPRGFAEGGMVAAAPPPFGVVFNKVVTKATFWHLALAAALHAFTGYGVSGFHPSFLQRTHEYSQIETGFILAVVSGVSGIGGTWFGGWLADRLTNARNDVRWQLWTPGIATLLNVPVALAAYIWAEGNTLIGLLFVSLLFGVMYLGPTYATMQRLVSARERALGSAMLLLIVNLVGLGLGPYLVGKVSDFIRAQYMADGFERSMALAQGLRWALAIMVCVNIWSFVHYMIAARTLVRDSET